MSLNSLNKKRGNIKNSTFSINDINRPDAPKIEEVKDNTKTDVQTKDVVKISGNYL